MKIINKSGKELAEPKGSYYIILSPSELSNLLENKYFSCSDHPTSSTEEEAINGLDPGFAVAKVTLVAKIV